MRFHPNTIRRIELINLVGISKLRKYCRIHHPGENFNRNIQLMRDYIKYGTGYIITHYNITAEYSRLLIRRYAKYAKEILEGGDSDG